MRLMSSKIKSGLGPLAVATLCSAALVGCSGDEPTVPKGIRAEPVALDFGFVPAGASVTKAIVIVNEGDDEVQITGVKIDGDARGAFRAATPAASIAFKGRGTQEVTYVAPQTPGDDKATLLIANNNSVTPSLSIALHAVTNAPECKDEIRNGTESDLDCGGDCEGCDSGKICTKSTDCKLGLGCADGKCGACETNAQCGAGSVCAAGQCAGCATDLDCPAAHTCDAGTCKRCEGANGRLDTKRDPLNCGSCGKICGTPLNSPSACFEGVCGRGLCKAGTFDIDGAATFGCEATCTGKTCTKKDGTKEELSAVPVSESGVRPLGSSGGAAWGANVQTSPSNTNFGVLGKGIGPSLGPAPQSNANYKHFGGFTSGLRK